MTVTGLLTPTLSGEGSGRGRRGRGGHPSHPLMYADINLVHSWDALFEVQ